jgi:hypothetical protein
LVELLAWAAISLPKMHEDESIRLRGDPLGGFQVGLPKNSAWRRRGAAEQCARDDNRGNGC